MRVPPARVSARLLPLAVTSRRRKKRGLLRRCNENRTPPFPRHRPARFHPPSLTPTSFSSSSSLSRFCFVCAHFIPCAASWQAGQGLPSHHTPFPSHAAWGRNTRCPRQGQAQTAHTTLPPSPPPTQLIGRRAKKEKERKKKKEPALLLLLLLLTQMI